MAEIVPWLLGGLGNQMFVLAAAWVASKVNDGTLHLFNFHNEHNKLKHNYKETIFKFFGQHMDIEQSDNLLNELLNTNYTVFKQNGTFSTYDPTNCPLKCVFMDYFQFYPPLAPYEKELRELCLQGLESLRNQIVTNYGSLENSAFLHVRRGDYLNNPHIHTIQPISYYEEALTNLSPTIETIFIFSDDLEFVKNETFFSSDSRFKIIENSNELYNLAFMTLCQGGAICANSTFSWWGAFLGTYGSRNPVIIPRDWIHHCGDCSGLFPLEWIQI